MPNSVRCVVLAATVLSKCNDTITGSETCMHGLCFCQAMGFHEDKFAAFSMSCDPRKHCRWTSACGPKKSFQGFQKKRLFGFGAVALPQTHHSSQLWPKPLEKRCSQHLCSICASTRQQQPAEVEQAGRAPFHRHTPAAGSRRAQAWSRASTSCTSATSARPPVARM